MLSLLILAGVFLLIAARRVGRVRVAMWQTMAGGALLVLLTGQIGPARALAAIDWDVMLFLAGMFLVGRALIQSGLLFHGAFQIFRHARTPDTLVLALVLTAGLASALLMNDTLAIVGTALALRLAQQQRIEPRLLLLALAFAVTIGSVASPIGNPQNLLIAVRGEVSAPFLTFAWYLGPPTLLNLLLVYGWLRLLFPDEFQARPLAHVQDPRPPGALSRLAGLSLGLILALVLVKIGLVVLNLPWEMPLSLIALGGALPVLASRERLDLLKGLDWHTLLFFAAMFVLMAAVWDTGLIQGGLAGLGLNLHGVPAVLAVGLLVSQLISNVPLVALYLPLLPPGDTVALMALAAGSTLAGNVLILGAASNVIILQQAERQGVHLGFFLFARVGIPLALVNVALHGAWLWLVA